MAGIGSEAVGGLSALQASLRQRIMDQIAQQERERAALVQDRNFSLQSRQLDQNDQFRRDQLAETARQHTLADEDRRIGLANTLADQIPAGSELAPDDPGIKLLQSGGRAALLQPLMTLPSRQTQGGLPVVGGDTSTELTTTQKAPVVRGQLKLASAKQADTEADNARQLAAQTATQERQNKTDAETERHHKAVENKPAPLSTVTIQTVDAQGNPVTRVVPKGEAVGKDFAAKPNATTANRLDSAKAVNQTGEDIIAHVSDPKVAAMLGPAMGRYNSLREFIGNPPPELSELAGQIESYALANMGVHGMRSTQGAEQIKQLLDRKHTPESLAATIRGLNKFSTHFLENAGRGAVPSTAPTKPSAAELIKKYGGQ
jgi:hypothetical protein